ncbi:class III signal peptide-containing protein [Methanocaldococcus sp. 28A]
MISKLTKSKKAQVSLEFSILFLFILLISLITISYFLLQNFSKDDLVIDSVDSAAKTSVLLINSGYNGIHSNTTLIYVGISWSDDKKSIYIYISPDNVTSEIKNFIKSYIYNTTKINQSVYNISIITINPT